MDDNIRIVIPRECKKLMNIIINNGYECFLAGSIIRDYFFNIPNKDYDLAYSIH